MGEALFEEVMPENNISFAVAYGDLYYEDELSVTDHDLTLEVNLAELNTAALHDRKIRLYPNPATTYVMLDTGADGKVRVEIMCINGTRVFGQDYESRLIRLDVKKFKPGLYFIRTQSESGNVTSEKLIVK